LETFLRQKDPIEVLEQWLADAEKIGLRNPGAFVLSTVDERCRPSSRVVLIKEVRPGGIVFYTNYDSRKGKEIEKNPRAAANFHWDALGRQICARGSLEKTTREESVAYWNTRPRESQIAQYVSRQSEPVADRETLERLFAEAERQFDAGPVPCPRHWGGYLLVADEIEFWIADPRRFHDRYQYLKVDGEWQNRRLSP
jgi:pyridoxamine 5'-phosphate oxidase